MKKQEKEALRRIVFDNEPPRGWVKSIDRAGWQTPKGRYFVSDKNIHQETIDNTCAICGDGPDPDIRWLRIACFYELHEISNKFQVDIIKDKDGYNHRFYILPFCKSCRGHFMSEVLGKWLNKERIKAKIKTVGAIKKEPLPF